jgi:hypothetical protein
MRAELSVPMRDLLWEVAQFMYGWRPISRRRIPVADALVRRGLVRWGEHGRDHWSSPEVVATEAGREEIARRWPVSPFILGTYDHQPGGWTPREGAAAPAREEDA